MTMGEPEKYPQDVIDWVESSHPYLRDCLRESAVRGRMLHDLFHQSIAGVALVGPDGRFLRVNKRFAEVSGWTKAELEDRTFMDITAGDDIATDLEMFKRVQDGEVESYPMPKRYRDRLGREHPVDLFVWPVRNSQGRFLFALSFVKERALDPKYLAEKGDKVVPVVPVKELIVEAVSKNLIKSGATLGGFLTAVWMAVSSYFSAVHKADQLEKRAEGQTQQIAKLQERLDRLMFKMGEKPGEGD